MRFGLALGGGAARGLAHIGVLKVLERESLVPGVLVGTSAGALVGAAYGCHGSAVRVEERFVTYASGEKFRKSSYGMFKKSGADQKPSFLAQLSHLVKKGVIFGVTATKPSFISQEAFAADLEELLTDIRIEDMAVRFAAIATDVTRGLEVVLGGGPVKPVVAASCALPGVLPPVPFRDTALIDGGSVNKVPAGTVRGLGANFVVAVDIHAALEDDAPLTRGLDIVSRSHLITGHALRRMLLSHADVVIRPQVGHIHWADFGRYAELIRLGEQAAVEALPAIRQSWARARVRSLLPWARRPVPSVEVVSFPPGVRPDRLPSDPAPQMSRAEV